MELASGTQILGGRYTVAEKVGSGAFGDVYRVKHIRLGRFDALKLLKSDLACGDAFVQFCREACTAAELGSDNIVVVHDHDVDNDIGPFIVFEYCAKGSLRDRLRASGRLAPDSARHIAMAVCSGLQPAHEREIVHRDIKPENILFTSRDVPKISDFGLVHIPGEVNVMGGTPAYMAPEQFQNHHATPSSDIYAVGAVLFEMLTGQHYLQAAGMSWRGSLRPGIRELAQAVGSLSPPPPSRVNDAVPGWFDEVCVRAMSKSPSERYSSAAELGKALKHVAADPTPEIRCHSCRGAVDPAQRFCCSCGTSVRQTQLGWACANCGSSNNTPANRFCTQCGYRRCAKCGKAFPSDLRFCTDDGTCLAA